MSAASPQLGSTRAPMLSQLLTDAFRRGDREEVSSLSPHAACLPPILSGLGWEPYSREVIDSLPHFADRYDLIDLLNTLVHMGYQSDPRQVRLERINDDLLPCLFVGNNGALLVVQGQENGVIQAFDAHTREEVELESPRLRGTAYVFTHLDEEQALAGSATSSRAWFTRMLARFRSVFVHLLLMSTLINALALAMPFFILAVYDSIIGVGSADSLGYFVAGISMVLLAELALRYLRSRSLGLVAGRMDYLIGVETFRHLLFLPPLMTERAAVSSQLARLKQFDTVRGFFAGPGALALLDLPFVLVFLMVMAVFAGSIALVPAAMLLVYAIFAALWLPVLNERVSDAGTAKTLRTRRIMDTLTGIRELKALGAETPWRDTCREAVSSSVMEDYRTARAHIMVNTVAHGAQTVAAIAVLGLGAHEVMQGTMSVGMLIAVMTLMWRILAPLQTLFLTYVKFDQTAQVIRQINQLMQVPSERRSPRSSLLIPRVEGSINFDRVSFRYGNDRDPVVLGASFRVEPREFATIIGGNGSGKSTLLKLAMGLYHPQAGTVSIDRLDLRQFSAGDLRREVAYVPQQPKLFFGTIEQNLRLADPGASDAALEEACARAGILDILLEELPEGLATRVGDQTTHRLPSGIVHGICLARAFLRDAPILLLDEPGSSLDCASDERLIKTLQGLRGSRTILMVSHRPSHIRLADKVITIERGSIAGVGPPDLVLPRYLQQES